MVRADGGLLDEVLIPPCLFVALTNTQVLPTDGVNCRDWVRKLLQLDEWSEAQLAQYNKFVENGFKN